MLQDKIMRAPPALLTRRTLLLAGSMLALPALAQPADKEPNLDAPYVPTPQDVVDRMLELAHVTAEDYVMDLGCGDGRILVTAAVKYGARGFGVDIDPRRIAEAKANAAAAGVSDKVDFGIEDLFHTPIGKASVLTLYLFPHINEQLAPRMLKEMKPGSRIVTHAFGIGKWRPDQNDMVAMRPIHFYVVPAQVEGRWRVTEQNGSGFTLDLVQSFQRITGGVEGSEGARLRNARIAGPEIAFALETANSGRREFTGRVSGGSIAGDGWTAQRISNPPPPNSLQR